MTQLIAESALSKKNEMSKEIQSPKQLRIRVGEGDRDHTLRALADLVSTAHPQALRPSSPDRSWTAQATH